MIVLISALFIVGYILISAEGSLRISKSAIALVLGTLMWLIIAFRDRAGVTAHLGATGLSIFEIAIFLLSAMTLVEILVHYKFFDLVRCRLAGRRVTTVQMLWITSGLAFISSAVIDNLTTAIIFTQLARLFFKGRNLIVAVAAVVIAANAGGAFSPIGDVTTTLLWLNEKFTTGQILLYAFIPSLVVYFVAIAAISTRLDERGLIVPSTECFVLRRSEKLVVGFAFGSFSLPFIFHSFGLRPYLGLLAGLGLTWIVIDVLRRQLQDHETHFTASIERFLQNTDIATIEFFVGILLAVSALDYLGILGTVSDALFGQNPGLARFVAGGSLMGVFSAFVDNVPLTAAAIQVIKTTDAAVWALIALAVGTGGSMLLIGSAAGIASMGMVKELNFTSYVKVATLPAVLGFLCGIGIWYLQYLLFASLHIAGG